MNEQDKNGNTPFILAAKNEEIVEHLIGNGISYNIVLYLINRMNTHRCSVYICMANGCMCAILMMKINDNYYRDPIIC